MNLDIATLKMNAVTTLDGSKRLFELGVPQHSMFFWNVSLDDPAKTALNFNEKFVENGHWKNYSAFTTLELGYWLNMVELEGMVWPDGLDLGKMSSDEVQRSVFN